MGWGGYVVPPRSIPIAELGIEDPARLEEMEGVNVNLAVLPDAEMGRLRAELATTAATLLAFCIVSQWKGGARAMLDVLTLGSASDDHLRRQADNVMRLLTVTAVRMPTWGTA